MDLLDKWCEQKLELDEVTAEVKKIGVRNQVSLTDKDAAHIAGLIMGIYYKFHAPERVVGHVSMALIKNNFYRFFRKADLTNGRAAVVYHEYFYNWAPEDWRQRILAAEVR
jgi:hypothetical protein